MLPFLGATVGVPMGLSQARDFDGWALWVVALAAAVAMVAVGAWLRTRVLGQVATALGLALWSLCGLPGLSTGT
jgi:hypothetical protein